MKAHQLIKELVDRDGGSLPVAKAMGSPAFQPTLHKFISGNVSSPSRATAERIAKHYRLPVDAIYDDRIASKVAAERGIKIGAGSSGSGSESEPVTEKYMVDAPKHVAVIHANLSHPEAAVLLRMVRAAKLPGVDVEVKKWSEIPHELGHGKRLGQALGLAAHPSQGAAKKKARDEGET